MEIKGIEAENFENYKVPSLFIAFPKCTFKCDKEAGCAVCQNSALASSPSKYISVNSIIQLYENNPISKAMVLGGLEPFDSPDDIFQLISLFRGRTDDDVVIYTGYTEEELNAKYYYTYNNDKISFLDILKRYKNIIVKFGRFIPNKEKHYDTVLGLELASPNQYAKILERK